MNESLTETTCGENFCL